MNDEIEEILENIKKCCDVMIDQNFVVYQKQEILKLLDYITNLQQEKDSFEKIANQNYKVAEDYKSRNEKAIEYLELRRYSNEEGEPSPDLDEYDCVPLLNILQGFDKE